MARNRKESQRMKPDEPTTPTPILLRPEHAAAVLNISRSHFDSLNASGAIGPKPVTLGRLKLWPRYELERWAQAGCPSRVQWLNRND